MRTAVRTLAPAVLAFGLIAAAPAPSEPLRWFSGEWRCDGHFSNGKPIASTLRFEWQDAPAALVKRHDDRPPNQYHSIELWTFDKAAGFRAMIADAYSGARLYTSMGWAGDTFTWERSQAGKAVERFAYTRTGKGAMQVDWSTSRDGATFTLGDTLACVKV
jgi:hypothetical protein